VVAEEPGVVVLSISRAMAVSIWGDLNGASIGVPPNGCFVMENGGLTMQNAGLTMKNGGLSWKMPLKFG
jgi:hypothetical protein